MNRFVVSCFLPLTRPWKLNRFVITRLQHLSRPWTPNKFIVPCLLPLWLQTMDWFDWLANSHTDTHKPSGTVVRKHKALARHSSRMSQQQQLLLLLLLLLVDVVRCDSLQVDEEVFSTASCQTLVSDPDPRSKTGLPCVFPFIYKGRRWTVFMHCNDIDKSYNFDLMDF